MRETNLSSMKDNSRARGQAGSVRAPGRGQPRNSPRELLLHLQATAGNRAVSGLVASGPASSSAPVAPLQRTLAYHNDWTVPFLYFFSRWVDEHAKQAWAEIQPAFDGSLAPALKRLQEFKVAGLLGRARATKAARLLDWLDYDTAKIPYSEGKKLRKQHTKLLLDANELVKESITDLQGRLEGKERIKGYGTLSDDLDKALAQAASISAADVGSLAGRVKKLESEFRGKGRAEIPTEEATPPAIESSFWVGSSGPSRRPVSEVFTEKAADDFVNEHPPAEITEKFSVYEDRLVKLLRLRGYKPKDEEHRKWLNAAWSAKMADLKSVPETKFDPENPGTWKKEAINDVAYADGLSEAEVLGRGGHLLLNGIKNGSASGNTKGGGRARARATVTGEGATFHEHLGSGGLCWAYVLEKGDRVTPHIYDIADKREKGTNVYYWKRGPRSNGTSTASFV